MAGAGAGAGADRRSPWAAQALRHDASRQRTVDRDRWSGTSCRRRARTSDRQPPGARAEHAADHPRDRPASPGAGRVWRVAQSPLLRLNSMAADIAVFTGPTVACEDFDDWWSGFFSTLHERGDVADHVLVESDGTPIRTEQIRVSMAGPTRGRRRGQHALSALRPRPAQHVASARVLRDPTRTPSRSATTTSPLAGSCRS